MQDDALTVCEMWDLTRPTIPPRSRLYHLEPIGLGTPYVESLTGYVARLAEVHSVRTRKLVVHEVLPLLGRAHLSKRVDSSLSAFWSRDARALNGTRTLAHDWVQALKTLTLRNDLQWLTLLTWADVLTTRGLLRPNRAWCSDCYQEWREARQVVYEPLLWTLKVITACPRHRRRLLTRCPYLDCQRAQSPLGPRARPGHCSRCEQWLGVSPEAGEVNDEAVGEDEMKWQAWVVEVVGELLATAPTLSVLPQRERMAAAVCACIEQATEGNTAAFARELRVSDDAVWGWRRYRQVPQLDLLLRMCYRCGLSPLQFLTEDAIVVDSSNMNPPIWSESPRSPKARRRPFDADGLQRALEAVLASDEHPPPPMREIARRLGYGHSHLYKRFPELCREISARYMTYQKACGIQRRQQLCEEVRQAAYRIHARGMYPSAYRIEQILSVPGFIRHPDAIATWHEALQELGWES